jgi:peptidoglycan/LPS O-acetylase OafA/YrhL
MTRYSSQKLVNNNFDLIRMVFALTVCLVHASQLSGYAELGKIAGFLSSSLAVKGFFVVSGFLIFMSFDRSSSTYSYMIKRLRRIYPAYFTVVLLCSFLLFFISTKSFGEYFSIQWLKYLVTNLVFLNFLQPTLPGVFETNIMTAVNGALWTLKIEVAFYLCVPVFVFLFKKFTFVKSFLAIYGLSVLYGFFFTEIARNTGSDSYLELSRQLPGQMCYFITGGFFYYYLELFERKSFYFFGAAVLILFLSRFYPLFFLEPFALATIVIFFSLFFYVGNFGKYGDFSYGVYILHFPILQIFLQFGISKQDPWLFLFLILLALIFGAYLMWNLVEKRFLPHRNTRIFMKRGSSDQI